MRRLYVAPFRFLSACFRLCFPPLLAAFCLVTGALAPDALASAPGALDAGFNPGTGAQKLPVIRGLFQDSADTYIVYGAFSTVGGEARPALVRLDYNGATDATFAANPFNGEVRALARRSDGKLYVGGNFTLVGSRTFYDLALLDGAGVLDNNFWSAFAGQGVINALAVQAADDYVLCGGYGLQLAQVQTDPTRHLVRIQSNGFADGAYPVFNGSGAYIVKMDTDSLDQNFPDRLVVKGACNTGTGTQINWRTTLSNAGAVLYHYPDGADNDGPQMAAIPADGGKYYFVGNFTKVYGRAANRVVRLDSNTFIDTSFNIGSGPNGDVTGALRLADDTLIVVGAFTSFNGVACNRIVHLLGDGSVDTSFGTGQGTGANAPILSIGTLQNGQIYVTGAFTTYNGQPRAGLAAITTGGALGSGFAGFSPAMSASTTVAVNDLVAQPDGKIVIGGDFNWFGGVWSPNVARLLPEGGVDATFAAGLGPDGAVHDVALRADGKIYAGGDFGGVDTRPPGGLARFSAAGALDTVFKPVITRADFSPAPVYAVLPLNGDKVLVGGHVRKISTFDRGPVARLNADGSLDGLFNPQITITNGTSLAVHALAQDQGKYYVGGYVTYESLARGFFTRVTDTGALDATFTPTTPSPNVVVVNSTVREIAVQPDHKVMFCGDFLEIIDGSIFNRPQRRGLARYTSTGALDPFDSVTGALSLTYVDSLSLEPNGGVLFAGGFTTYNDVSRVRLARAKRSGVLDTWFNPGTGVDARARVIRRVGPTRGLIGGEFTTYNGVPRSRLAAFMLDPQQPAGTAVDMLLLMQ